MLASPSSFRLIRQYFVADAFKPIYGITSKKTGAAQRPGAKNPFS
jgi:hypothetical protein